jgi:hypothetical protein
MEREPGMSNRARRFSHINVRGKKILAEMKVTAATQMTEDKSSYLWHW